MTAAPTPATPADHHPPTETPGTAPWTAPTAVPPVITLPHAELLTASVNFTEEGRFHSVLDAVTLVEVTKALAEAQQLSGTICLRGGSARRSVT
ncbi:hypothetical protein ACH4SP_03495 [Streptomyces sp. NPDC021093]|uniref:hypothetical protein n=1 Tax=Streptomyces sp. NPDC021093 TaxID=3365112 RepID=UPI00379FFB8A